MKAELSGAGLRPQQTALGLRGAVDLIVNVFAGVHVEAGVEKGAVAKAFVSVLVNDATEESKQTAISQIQSVMMCTCLL